MLMGLLEFLAALADLLNLASLAQWVDERRNNRR